MAKKLFLQKGHPINLAKHSLAGRFLSEKLDGIRFMWDGGVTRGLPVEVVPWANLDKSNEVPISTGLWSNYGKVFNAPDWWIDNLPPYPVEGEFWTERQDWQRLSSIVNSNVNVKDWTPVKAMIFDVPHPVYLFADREINETNMKKVMRGCYEFFLKHGGKAPMSTDATFQTRVSFMRNRLPVNSIVMPLDQEQLPFSDKKARERLDEVMDGLLNVGAEGTVIKAPNDLWTAERCWSVLKYKPWLDAEAKVVGYRTGRETDKGSKLLGLMGSLICEISAGKFKISGFNDDERQLFWQDDSSAYDWCAANPDAEVGGGIYNPKFPRGTIVTFKYRELSEGGIPKEARFWRKRASA